MHGKIYQFDNYLLDIPQQRLQKNGEDIQLSPKVFDVLSALIENNGQLLTHEELMDTVWKDSFVEETNLRYCIHSLRKAFDKDYIETIPKRGYRFNAGVKSYSSEEFIKKPFKPNKPSVSETTLERTEREKSSGIGTAQAFFSKPVGILVVALFGIGLFAYYAGQKDAKSSLANEQTIMILPFSVIGGDSGKNSELQKGLVDSLVFNLGKIRNLKPIQAKEIKEFTKDEAIELGKRSGSDMVLEGSYHFGESQHARVNVELLRSKNGEEVLAESLEIKAESRIEAEKIAALRIGRMVYNKLEEISDRRFLETQEISEDVKKKYLLGQQMLRSYEMHRREEGLKIFSEIIEKESKWAPGFAKHSEAIFLLHGYAWSLDETWEIVDKTLALDNTRPEAHMTRGWYHVSRFEWEKAEKSFKKSAELNPDYALAYDSYGKMLGAQRRFVEAKKMFDKAVEAKPFDPYIYSSLCDLYFYEKKFKEAEESCNTALQIEPRFNAANKNLWWIYVFQDGARGIFRRDYDHLSQKEIEKDPIAQAAKEGNNQKYWLLVAEKRLKTKSMRYSPLAVSGYYAMAGDMEKTLEHLERIPEKFPDDIIRVNPSPVYDIVRQEPRFVRLMKKHGLNP